MRALVVGAGGQIGRALVAAAPAGWAVTGLARAALDVRDRGAVTAAVARWRPDVVVNAAAYTAVDRAEGARAEAFALNSRAAGGLAAAAAAAGARSVVFSSDYVFDGRASVPYPPDAPARPLSVYGAAKLAGEVVVLAADPRALVVRTAWVHSAGAGFVRAVLARMRRGEALSVVDDQRGAPSAAGGVARACWGLVAAGVAGVWHWTDAGDASWHQVAVAVGEESEALGVLAAPPVVRAVSTAEYGAAAARPAFSVLDCAATYALIGAARPWREGVRETVRAIVAGG